MSNYNGFKFDLRNKLNILTLDSIGLREIEYWIGLDRIGLNRIG